MGRETRVTIVPFPTGPRPGRPDRAGAGGPAEVYRPWAEDEADAKRNEAWDELLRLVDKAWTWRDPDALNEIDTYLLRLGLVVEAEWS